MTELRELWGAVRGVVVDTVIESWDTIAGHVKAKWAGNARITPNVEPLFPQGVYFGIPAGARGVLLAPLADPSRAKALVQGDVPPTLLGFDDATPVMLQEGEGGLHFLGTWQVFVHSDGVILGGVPTDAIFPLARSDRTEVVLQAIADRVRRIEDVVDGWTPVPNDGGAALKTLWTATPTAVDDPVAATGCDKVQGV